MSKMFAIENYISEFFAEVVLDSPRRIIGKCRKMWDELIVVFL